MLCKALNVMICREREKMDGLGKQHVHREFTRRKKGFLLNHIMGSEEQSCPLIYLAAPLAQNYWHLSVMVVFTITRSIKKCGVELNVSLQALCECEFYY